jgi:O-antigen/teichoic acid export membrane protein
MMYLGFGVREVLYANIASLTAGVLFGFVLLHRLVPLTSLFSPSLLSGDTKKRALKYALTIAGVLSIGYLVNQQAEVFFIGMFCSVEEVGFYHLAFKISAMVRLLPLAFAYALLPAIAERFGSGELEKIKRMYRTSARYLMMVALPLAAGGIALANSLIIVLYGADYVPAAILIQVLIVPFAIGCMAGAGDSVIRGMNRPGFILKVTAVLAIMKIGLLLWLIRGYGVVGAAIASSLPLILGLPAMAIFIHRNVGAGWPIRDTVKITLASLIMGVAVYAVQSQMDVVPSLVLGIPLGVVIYISAIFLFRVVDKQDLVHLKSIQGSLPAVMRKYYGGLIVLMEWMVIKKKLPAER